MKQTTLTQRLLSALVALCMVLSVCAPALAADDRVIWIQKSGETVQLLNAITIGTKLPGCSYAYDGTTVTITMEASKEDVMADVTLAGGASTDIVLVCTNNTRMDDGRGLTITGMRNVTIKTEDPSKTYTGAFYGALKVKDCYGNVTVTNPHGAAVVYSLDVDNTAGTGNVTITGSNANGSICAVAGAFGTNASIASNGDVKIENIVSGMFGAQLRYQAVDGELTVTSSKSVTTTGGASKVDITSTGAVEIKSDDTKNVVGNGLSVNAGDAVTVTGGGAGDAAAAIKGDANITAGGGVNVSNFTGIAVDGNLTVNSSTGVTVVGNTQRNAVRYAANITSSGAVNISNSRGIAVGGKLTVKNASGTGDVTVSGKGGNTVGRGAEITSRGAVNITNTDNTGLAVSGNLTVHDSNSVKVSGGTANSPAVSGNITLTSTGKMELRNPNGQVTSNKLTVENSTGEVIVTGNKSGSTALVKCGASIDTTGAVTITNSSGPAIFGGLNVERSGGITVTGSRASAPIITDSSTIKNTGKVEIINSDTGGQTAESITYTPPAGNGYFYRTAQNGTKLHTRKAISGTTPYLCIEPDTLYTLTLSDGVTATTGGTKDTKFYAGESVTVTAPADTETTKFEKWTFSGTEPTGLPNGWETSKEFTFKMPASNVTLGASYHTITKYEVKVTGGTIVGGNGDTGNYLPGTEVTVTAPADTDTKKFEKWTGGDNIIDAPSNWRNSSTFTFTMPADDVTLKAEYKTAYTLTVDGGKGTILVNGMAGSRALAGDQITVTETGSDKYHLFSSWQLTSSTALVEPSENWENSKTFTFKMPAGNVSLKADYKQLYDLTVTGGTIVDESSDTGKPSGIYLPGTKVTVVFDDSHDIAKQFKQWKSTDTEPEAPTAGWPEGGWQNSKKFTFKMPTGNVTLEAEYKTVYNVSVDDRKGTILVNGVEGSRALAGDEITVTETGSDEHHLFSSWELTSSTALVEPSENWENSKTFTFKMPAGNVSLKADYKQLYDLTVTGGTIVDESSDTGKPSGIYLPGTKVTVVFDDSHDIAKQFKQWKSTDTEPEAPDGGWTAANDSTSKTFTFKMPAGNVTLKAEYKTVYNVSVADSRGTVLVNNEERSRALEGETVTVKTSDTFFNAYHQFNGWSLSDDSAQMVEPSENWQTSKEFTFTMPAGNVTLKADYKQLYDLAVTGGTIVDESGDTGETTGIYLPGTEVTIQFTESDDITKQFKQWKSTDTEPEAPDGGWTEENNSASKTFTFKMPAGDVTLEAVYRETYHLSEYTNKAEFFVKDQQVHQAPAGVRVTVKLVDDFINDHREFDQWQLGVGTALVKPEEGWEHKPSFSFTMPEGDVELLAFSTTLYDLTVNGGTIVDETSETGTSKKIVKPGQLVTVRAESTEENPFLQWTHTGKAPVEPDDGWQTSPEFTFKMPNGNVTLEAQRDQLYKVSINDSLGSVTINGEPRSSLWVKEGEPVTVATTLKDGYWMEFKQWTAQDGSTTPVEPSDNWQTSTTFTFKMPNGPVELVAQWSASSLDPYQPIDPDEPLDEDFGVEPDTTGGTIAAVAVGGAAIWGGYEIATRVILHSLLPEGTVIPASRGQLALLVWNTAGRPEPAGAPAFADVTDPDMAKAAQWCTEQGTMGAKGDRFEPEGWTPKFKVIEVWNKAFPAA